MALESGEFASLELSESMGKAILEDKLKKYAARLEKRPGGKCVVYWRGLTAKEQAERSRQKRMAKGIS
ncbi:hypothetical protein SAMN05216312_12240 [Cohnella sp. OV330]|uniref:hypothetical protein n=1 Tax=Cohnella sp. OV330 TaxID=1855288 RepID=UPI0008E406A1|nr:hypothetical protein [Cohnella sp. OV330]SFB62684.1 hypothetical protein SAMN05216312_12240 [Cohnella sp. OV330]